jgi:hypothetical protein
MRIFDDRGNHQPFGFRAGCRREAFASFAALDCHGNHLGHSVGQVPLSFFTLTIGTAISGMNLTTSHAAITSRGDTSISRRSFLFSSTFARRFSETRSAAFG